VIEDNFFRLREVIEMREQKNEKKTLSDRNDRAFEKSEIII